MILFTIATQYPIKPHKTSKWQIKNSDNSNNSAVNSPQ